MTGQKIPDSKRWKHRRRATPQMVSMAAPVPAPDLVLAYRSNYAVLRRDLSHADAEPAAYDRVVALCQSTGLDLETSKQRAMAAMRESLRLEA
jgi:hypothetical protein